MAVETVSFSPQGSFHDDACWLEVEVLTTEPP